MKNYKSLGYFFIFLLLFIIIEKAFAFEYSISGPKVVSSLENIPYRIVIFDNQQNKKIPVKVIYKNKLIKETVINKTENIFFNLSSLNIKENEEFTLNFLIDSNSYNINIKYIPEIKALIFTDKPLYQPGQTVYIKGIVFKNNKPLDQKVELVITDPKSNKIFYKTINPNNGIIFEKFSISDLVINGVYKIDFQINGKSVATNTFEVKKYVLPKFKIELNLLGEPQVLQLGKTYKAKLSCSYFFGKKVSNARVKIDVFSFDIGFNKIYSLEGKTDKDGQFLFDLKIPSYLAGIEKNKGLIKVEIEVEDEANQIEQKTLLFDIFKDPIEVFIIPSNKPIVGMNNKFYLVINSLGNKENSFQVKFKKPFSSTFKTTGFLEFEYKPSSLREKFLFQVIDENGNYYDFEKDILSEDDKAVFIFRDKAIYKVGEKLRIGIYSNLDSMVYLDFFVKSDNTLRTVLTDSLSVNAYKVAYYETSINPNFKGYLIVRAYFVKKDGTIVDNYKSFVIEDPQELDIKVKKNKDVYKVRDKLELNIEVNEKSSIFVDIVDEALLYLAQSNPELLKLYLQLEKEILEPRYEAHLQLPLKEPLLQKKENILKAALDSLYLQNKQNQYEQNLETIFNYENVSRFFNSINSVEIKKEETLKKMSYLYQKCFVYYNSQGKFPEDLKDLRILGITRKDYLDSWGNEIKIKTKGSNLELVSAGLDRKFYTNDDIIYPVYKVYPLRDFGLKTLAVEEKQELKKSPLPENTSENDFLIRQYFPETFYSGLIKVDKNYKFSLVLPDSITNWKAQFFAVSSSGKLGSKTIDITVFQEFFVDINNPLFLTQEDEISLPITVYNYTNKKLEVKVQIKKEDWFQLQDQEIKNVSLEPQSIKSVYFKIRAKKIGINKLTVFAYSDKFKDAIKKDIEVLPNGFAVFNNKSAYVEKDSGFDFVIPNYSIDNSYKVYLYVYPGFSSQILSGLDKLISIPYGCFEQTSSINYPNILILKYLRAKNISNASIEMRAEYYLNIGYQRLLTFEVEGGGFSWFGDKPANKVLTAFGLMEFKDMKTVFFVDNNLIERTKKFLIKNQNPDGSWEPDKNYLHEESWGNIQKQKITVTSYILMALLDNDEQVYKQYNKQIKKSLNFVYNHLVSKRKEIDNYTLGLMLNIFASVRDKEDFADKAVNLIIEELEKRAIIRGEGVYWKGTKTLFYGYDISSDIETTSIIGLGLIKAKKFDLAIKVIKFLIDSKDNRGIWYSTQPTILALKTIVNFEEAYSFYNFQESKQVKISINEKEITINFQKDDLSYKIVDLSSFVSKGNNSFKIHTNGPVLFDLNYNFYLPFDKYIGNSNILDIDVKYDRSTLSVNDRVKVFVEVKNSSNNVLEMVVLDLGIPPGFSVDISKLQNNPKVKNVENTSRQIIVYFDKIDKNESISLEYDLISKYPLRVKALPVKAYEYYNPLKTVMLEGKYLEVK